MSEPFQKEPIAKKFERFISKLKVVKQLKQTNVMIKVENPVNASDTYKIQEINSVEENQNNLLLNQNNLDEKQDESSSNEFKFFYQEIVKFWNFIRNNTDLTNYLYKYPEKLQKNINIDVEELQNLLAEIKEITENTKKLKNQRKLIKTEASTLKKTIRRLKNNEIKELESIVSQYDKEMYTRWMKAKWKIDAMEDLMFDVQEKQIALENLQKLIDRCLIKIKENSSIKYEESEGNSASEDKPISLSSSIFSLESKIPAPPVAPLTSFIPRPIPLTVNNFSRSNSRLSWTQRRFRTERRGSFVPIRPITESRENELVFTVNLNDNNAIGNNVNFNSNTLERPLSRFSSNSTETISSGGSNNQRQVEDDFYVKTEMSSTIFGERNRNPILIITASNDSFNFHTIPEESNSNCS